MYRRIINLRKKANMSQLQFAEALHVSASTVGMYEQARRVPSLDILIRMSTIFSVSLDYLITGTNFTSSTSNVEPLRSADNCPCNTCYWKDYKAATINPYGRQSPSK